MQSFKDEVDKYLTIENVLWIFLILLPFLLKYPVIKESIQVHYFDYFKPIPFLVLIGVIFILWYIKSNLKTKMFIYKWFFPVCLWINLYLPKEDNGTFVIIFIDTFFSVLILWATYDVLKADSYNPEFNHGLISDNPIESDQENDSFGRKKYAESIVAEIRKTINKRAFNIAITGAWGSGKTSFLNLIKGEMDKEVVDDKIDKHEKVKFITVKYNPWDFKEDKIIGLDLLKTINYELANEKELQEKFKGLMASLQGMNQSPWYKVIPYFLSGFSKEKSINEYRKEIGDTLSLKGQKLVIFLDDLDRLDGDEILEVFKTIRNSFDIANTFFILGFDIDYVTGQIKNKVKGEEENDKSLEYLDKIFQMRLFMPSISDYNWDADFKNLIKLHFDFPENKNMIQNQGNTTPYIKDLIPINSKRNLLQLINSIKIIDYKNYNLSALLVTEWLKIKHPMFYAYIINNMDTIFQWYSLRDSDFFHDSEGKILENPWQNFKKRHVSKENNDAFNLLERFFQILNPNPEGFLNWEEYFKYFKFSIHSEEFPESLITQIIATEDIELITTSLNSNNQNSFYSKINNRLQISSDQDENWLKNTFIKLLFNNYNIFYRYRIIHGLNKFSFYSSTKNLIEKIKKFSLSEKIEFLLDLDDKNEESFEYLIELCRESFSVSDLNIWKIYYNLKECKFVNNTKLIRDFIDITKETISINYLDSIQQFISDKPDDNSRHGIVNKIIDEFTKIHSSQSLKVAFIRSEIIIDKKNITFLFPDQISIDIVTQEDSISEFIRKKLNDNSINLHFKLKTIGDPIDNSELYYLKGLISARDWLNIIPSDKKNESNFIEIEKWLKIVATHEKGKLNYKEVFGYEYHERYNKHRDNNKN